MDSTPHFKLMKMKKYSHIPLYFILVILTLNSCSEDTLNLEPADQIRVDNFWTSGENALFALTGCYETLLAPYRGAWLMELEQATPNAFETDDSIGASSIAQGLNDPENRIVGLRYSAAYEGVGRTNTFLANIDQVPMDEDLRSRLIAEASFLRAFYYHNLVEFFGGVPLILDPPDNSTQGQLPRNSKEEVLVVIFEDLDRAIAGLPVSYPASDQGRATRGAALALKARSALYNERWQEAIDASQQIIDLGIYELFPDYRGLFLLENEHSSEVIFNVEFVLPEFTNGYHVSLLDNGRVAPLQDLVDAYLMQDGENIEDSLLFDPMAPYDNRDPRLTQSIITVGSMFNGQLIEGSESFLNISGYGFKKYTYFVDDEVRAAPAPGQGEINAIVFRYAETLLTLAEAENELNGPTSRAYDAINQVRQRISVEMPPLNVGLDQNEFREAVRLERRVEFAGEGLYYNDILRWRTAEVIMNSEAVTRDGAVIQQRRFDPQRDYLWPFPATDVLLNENLEQNPGY